MKLKTCVIALALTLAPTVLAACNTIEGVGKDVSVAGGAVAGAAKDAKK